MSRSATKITGAMSQYISEHCHRFPDAEIGRQLGLSRDQVIDHRRRVLKIKKTHSSRGYRIKPQTPAIMRYPLEGFSGVMQSFISGRFAC